MDAGADDRLRSAVLVGAALAALAVGGWWWHATAPAPGAAPVVGPSVSTELERILASGVPEDRVAVWVDPQTGESIRMGGDRGRVIELDSDASTDLGADVGVLVPGSDLPSFRGTIWREQRELAPGEERTRQASDDGSRFLLQYRCTRPGTLAVTSTGAEIVGLPRIDCDGTLASARLLPGGGPFRVSLSAVGDRPIDVEAQLVALPPS
ncbi:hypothetical protein ACLQ25_21780 [Micromonospora sp. DT44]|uniref:hypothetical protein n=1 Tax=Micromonospora sp. DT44 TaxID=3393439 RepID=UPI003CE9501D